MLRKTYLIFGVRSVSTLPVKLYRKRDFERRKRMMRYIKEEYDYLRAARRDNIMFDMAMYKLDTMLEEMKQDYLDDPAKMLDTPRVREQVKLMLKYDPQYRRKYKYK